MEDTEWFESKSEDEKLTHLSQLINSPEASAKAEFKTLLNFVPVELVTSLNDFELSCQKRRLSKVLVTMDFCSFAGEYQECTRLWNSAARCCL